MPENIIESKKEGENKDFKYSTTASSTTEADLIFKTSAEKLMDVNNWSKWSGLVSAEFKLTDRDGNVVNRLPIQEDYIKIKIPAPGNKAGDGFDWVKIEQIINEEDQKGFKVRPSSNPQNPDESTAHFLSKDATSTFLISRDGNKIISEIHGRNEKPNLETSNVQDKARNLGVATGAILGLANIQWNLLAKGLLSEKDNN